MPPKSTTPAFFAITGNGTGGRNNLAPDNKWNVLVVRVEAASGKTTNERAQNLDGTLSEARGAARALPARWRDLPRFHPDAAGTAAEAGQHARRQPGHAGKELFVPGGHPAALPDPGHAISSGSPTGSRAPRPLPSRRHPSRRRSSPPGSNPSANGFCRMAGCFAASW